MLASSTNYASNWDQISYVARNLLLESRSLGSSRVHISYPKYPVGITLFGYNVGSSGSSSESLYTVLSPSASSILKSSTHQSCLVSIQILGGVVGKNSLPLGTRRIFLPANYLVPDEDPTVHTKVITKVKLKVMLLGTWHSSHFLLLRLQQNLMQNCRIVWFSLILWNYNQLL